MSNIIYDISLYGYGYIYTYVCCAKGPRASEYFPIFFEELMQQLPDMIVDNFAHFAIEKLFLCCSPNQIIQILNNLRSFMASVACQKHGSFTVQSLIKSISGPDQVNLLVDILRPHTLRSDNTYNTN